MWLHLIAYFISTDDKSQIRARILLHQWMISDHFQCGRRYASVRETLVPVARLLGKVVGGGGRPEVLRDVTAAAMKSCEHAFLLYYIPFDVDSGPPSQGSSRAVIIVRIIADH
jgi:hypothetical protein